MFKIQIYKTKQNGNQITQTYTIYEKRNKKRANNNNKNRLS